MSGDSMTANHLEHKIATFPGSPEGVTAPTVNREARLAESVENDPQRTSCWASDVHALTTRLHTPPHAVLQIPSIKQQPADNEHRNCRAPVYAERNGPATALVQHDHGISDRNESSG